jgi:hypothetical protein
VSFAAACCSARFQWLPGHYCIRQVGFVTTARGWAAHSYAQCGYWFLWVSSLAFHQKGIVQDVLLCVGFCMHACGGVHGVLIRERCAGMGCSNGIAEDWGTAKGALGESQKSEARCQRVCTCGSTP